MTSGSVRSSDFRGSRLSRAAIRGSIMKGDKPSPATIPRRQLVQTKAITPGRKVWSRLSTPAKWILRKVVDISAESRRELFPYSSFTVAAHGRKRIADKFIAAISSRRHAASCLRFNSPSFFRQVYEIVDCYAVFVYTRALCRENIGGGSEKCDLRSCLGSCSRQRFAQRFPQISLFQNFETRRGDVITFCEHFLL